MQTITIQSTKGGFTARFSHRGLAQLELRPSRRSGTAKNSAGAQVSPNLERWKQMTARALEDLFEGRTPKALPPLDLHQGTPFQRQVWNALQRIPLGKTRTYAQIAEAVGKPQASRAVGTACGANPIPIFVPCHRVLPKNGGLGGFSAGLEWKRRLLELEGVRV